MNGAMKPNGGGFTLLEIIAVLLLISIIAATVLGRAINTAQTDLASQTDKVRMHLRYVYSMAMKYGDQVWGVRCATNAGQDEYWAFRLDVPVANPAADPDEPANQLRLPGETDLRVNLTQYGVGMTSFTIFFDRYGRPYTSYTDDTTNTPLAAALPINISSLASDPPPDRTLSITPETGLIQ